jgi:hypothetical protein
LIAVVNAAYGGDRGENIPFNLRHRRWPIRYTCGLDTSAKQKKSVRKQLVADLVVAIRTVLGTHTPVQKATPFTNSNLLLIAPSRLCVETVEDFRFVPRQSLGVRPIIVVLWQRDPTSVHFEERKICDLGASCLRMDHYFVLIGNRENSPIESPVD